MEFKYRAADDKPPMYFPPASSVTYFYEQALRAGYSNTDPRQVPELMWNAMLQREIEKEQISEEIIVEEIKRRRVLEAEVRRELMMEREMAMRVGGGGGGCGGGLSFEERMTMRLYSGLPFPFMNQFDYRWLEERLPFHGPGVFNMFPQLPWLPEAVVAPGVKSASEDKKDNLIVLTKPDPNICGAKRKAGTPPAGDAGEYPFAGLKKKPKEEWSCALCQVSATSEKGFNEHLQGKKHKAKEAGLRAQKMDKNPGTAPLPKKTAKAAKYTTNATGVELEGKVEESLQDNKSDDGSCKETQNENDELLVQKNQHAEELKKNGAATMQREERTTEFRRKKKFKFWCKMCEIGAYSEVVMEDHRKGKKHLARLQELGQNIETLDPAITAMAPLEASKKAEDSEVITKRQFRIEQTLP